MEFRFIFVASILLCITSSSFATKSVHGYIKKDGTYVAPHQRSDPNRTQRDNYTSKPNVNPYNGKKGTKEPTR